VCRNSTHKEWYSTQRHVLRQISRVSKDKDQDVGIVGDIFNSTWDTSFELVTLVQDFALELERFGHKLYILAGNHDLPYHSLEFLNQSPLGVLLKSSNIFHLEQYFIGSQMKCSAANFGKEPVLKDAKVLFLHRLVVEHIEDKVPGSVCAKELCELYPNAEWIFVGDNHHKFFYSNGRQNVVVPGTPLRQTIDLKDYQPCIFIWSDFGCSWCKINDNPRDDFKKNAKKDEESIDFSGFLKSLSKIEKNSIDFCERLEQYATQETNEKLKKQCFEVLKEIQNNV